MLNVANLDEQRSPLDQAIDNDLIQSVETLHVRRDNQDSFNLRAFVRFPQDYRTHTINLDIIGSEKFLETVSGLIRSHVSSNPDDDASLWMEAVSDYLESEELVLTIHAGTL